MPPSPRPTAARRRSVPARPRPSRLGTKAEIRERAQLAESRLAQAYPVAECALIHDGPFQLLIATILSAQTTDERVNLVTPTLFARCPTAFALAAADPADVEAIIQPTGFFRAKTRSIIGCSRALVERFGGEVPPRMEDLVTLPGVGRKTANVVLGVAFHLPGLAVDTHVTRLTRLLGLTRNTDPVKIEADVAALLPPEQWSDFGLRLILHGRRVCIARRPRCPDCVLNDFCPSSSVIAPPAGTRVGAPPRPG
ncbi:MAG TPA: endonuclease III [Candidatus Dormibacteraeota bacterium]|jgi:endonuclease-3|nr:endonuclease III [Candidatus Dormibacteraeota bacterium]